MEYPSANKLWIQDEAVSVGDTLATDEDPSGAQESVSTYANGTLPVTAIWAIDPDVAVTHTEYDIVADNQAAGTVGTYHASSDLLDSANVAGFVAPVPELATVTLTLVGLLVLAGYFRYNRRKN